MSNGRKRKLADDRDRPATSKKCCPPQKRNWYRCTVCNVPVNSSNKESHERGKRHKRQKQEAKERTVKRDKVSGTLPPSPHFCMICDHVGAEDKAQHELTAQHAHRSRLLVSYCTCCDEFVLPTHREAHEASVQHLTSSRYLARVSCLPVPRLCHSARGVKGGQGAASTLVAHQSASSGAPPPSARVSETGDNENDLNDDDDDDQCSGSDSGSDSGSGSASGSGSDSGSGGGSGSGMPPTSSQTLLSVRPPQLFLAVRRPVKGVFESWSAFHGAIEGAHDAEYKLCGSAEAARLFVEAPAPGLVPAPVPGPVPVPGPASGPESSPQPPEAEDFPKAGSAGPSCQCGVATVLQLQRSSKTGSLRKYWKCVQSQCAPVLL